ncbi:hypothetical protein V8E53_008619 [Lactarius tabidus]
MGRGWPFTFPKRTTPLIGELDSERRGRWFIEALEILGEHIRSKATGQLVGFEGAPTEGLRLKVGAPAKVWMTHRYGWGYKIKLVDTPFVIEFPENNLDPGTFAQLGRDRENQIWYIKGD